MTEIRSYTQLVDEIRRLPGPVRLVGVDGCGGAGKTTFATRLSSAASDCPVVHTDDFATHVDALGWGERFLRDVITPLSRQRPAAFRPYDWLRREPAPSIVTIPPADIVVIEGVGATRTMLRDQLVMRVWIETPSDVRLRRGVDRDGEQLRGFWEWWRQQEDGYVAAEHPQDHADLVVDGNRRTGDDEFVVLSGRRGGDEPPARPR